MNSSEAPNNSSATPGFAKEMQNPFAPNVTTPAAGFATGDGGEVQIKTEQPFDIELAAAAMKLKKSIRLPDISALFGESYSLIAFQAGSFGLRGALVQNAKQQAQIKYVAQSNTVDFTRAIAEVLSELKQHHKRLPKQAILLTPSVVSALVQLPVSPLRPRTDAQMQELIRWELESVMSQQNKHWMIGSMLVERGNLTPEQRDEIVEELQLRQSQGGPNSLTRFGDLAVRLGYINREQLEECFTLQGKLVAIDDDLMYGWQANDVKVDSLSDEVLLSQEEDSDSSHSWLVSGISQSVRRRWLGAFKLNNIHLEAFYPSLGSAFANLWQHSDQDQQVLLEIHQEQIALISGDRQLVTEILTSARQSGPVTAQACLDLIGILPRDVKRLYITDASNQNLAPLMSELAEQLGCDIQHFSALKSELVLPSKLTNDALLGLQGAVNHYLKHTPNSRLSWINSQETKVSILKKILQPKVLLTSAACITGVLALGFIIWMYWNTDLQTKRLVVLENKFIRESKVQAQLTAIYAKSKNIELGLNNVATESEAINRLLIKLAKDRGYRRLTPTILLKTFSLALSQQIVLMQITKVDDVWTIVAKTTDNRTGNEFIDSLNHLLQPLDYQVTYSSVRLTDDQLYEIKVSMDYQSGLNNTLVRLNAKVAQPAKARFERTATTDQARSVELSQ